MATRSELELTTDVLVLGVSHLGAELVYLLRRRAPALRLTVVDLRSRAAYALEGAN